MESCSALLRGSEGADPILESRRGSGVDQGRHVGGAQVWLDARLQARCRDAVEPLYVGDAADDLRPGAGLGEALNKTEALGLGRFEAARRRDDFMRRIRPHQRGEATGAEHDAEAQARHPEPGCGRGDPPIAGGHQVGARSQRAAVAQRERRQRRMVQRLQELLDAHEPMQEIAVRLLIEVGKVEPRTEMPPLAAQRQQPRAAVRGPRDGDEQRLDQPRVERVGLVRPVEDKLDHRARLLDQKRIGQRASHDRARLFGGGAGAPGRVAHHSAMTSCVWAPSSGGGR